MIHILDLHFQTDHTIASFVVETTEGPVLIETGPHSVLPYLETGLAGLGYRLSDIQHVLLSHIHFDHAGAAWALAQAGAQVHVHPFGYRHLLDPTKLYQSAKRIYGDQMEALWGDMQPIAEAQLHEVADEAKLVIGEHTFKAWHTPGHAVHHIAWQLGEVIFTGDVAGVKIGEGPVVPPCPPPDINLEDWKASLNRLRALQPKALYLTHFGLVDDYAAHFDQLEGMLDDWAAWIKPHWEAGKSPTEVTPDFQAYAATQLRKAGLDAHQVDQYEAANPAWMSVAGLMRYWKKKAEQAEG